MGTAERRAVVEAVHWFRGSRTARSPRTSSFRKPASQSSKCTAVCLKGLYEPHVPLRRCLGLSDKLGRSILKMPEPLVGLRNLWRGLPSTPCCYLSCSPSRTRPRVEVSAAETTEGIQTAIRFISTATWNSTIYDQPRRGIYDRTPLEAFVRFESDPKTRP